MQTSVTERTYVPRSCSLREEVFIRAALTRDEDEDEDEDKDEDEDGEAREKVGILVAFHGYQRGGAGAGTYRGEP